MAVTGIQLNMITNILRHIYPVNKQHLNTDMEVVKYIIDMIAARGEVKGDGEDGDRRSVYGEIATQVLFDNYHNDNHTTGEDD